MADTLVEDLSQASPLTEDDLIYVAQPSGSPPTYSDKHATIGQILDLVASPALAAGKVKLTGGNITTTSTTFVDVAGATVTITTGARRCLVTFSGYWLNNCGTLFGTANIITLLIDGTNQGGPNGLVAVSLSVGVAMNPSFSFITDVLSAGSHTFKLQWRVSSDTGTLKADSDAPLVLSVVELPHTT